MCGNRCVIVYRSGGATYAIFVCAEFRLDPVENILIVCLMISSKLNDTFSQTSWRVPVRTTCGGQWLSGPSAYYLWGTVAQCVLLVGDSGSAVPVHTTCGGQWLSAYYLWGTVAQCVLLVGDSGPVRTTCGGQWLSAYYLWGTVAQCVLLVGDSGSVRTTCGGQWLSSPSAYYLWGTVAQWLEGRSVLPGGSSPPIVI